MHLIALTQAADVQNAYNQLEKRVTSGEQSEMFLGWPGGIEAGVRTVYWHPGAGIWALAEPFVGGYWFGFGTDNPHLVKAGAPGFQISLPDHGSSKRKAGRFAQDLDTERVFVLHSGVLGGKKKGLTKDGFLAFHGAENRVAVSWPNQKYLTEYIVVGDIADDNLFNRIASLVKMAGDYKQGLN